MPVAASLFADVAVEQVVALLARLPDPDLVLAQQGLGRHELRKLETDDEVSAALETRREALVATPWSLHPYDSEPAEWLWTELAPHMEGLLRGAFSALPYGYSVMEAVYRRGPRIGLARAEEKPIEWFAPQRDGTLRFTPPDGGMEVTVDAAAKFLLTRRSPTYRNPYGEALLSRLYWPWFFRHNGWRFWMRFVERFGDPLLIGKSIGYQELYDGLRGMGFDSVVCVGQTDELQAVTQGLAGEFERMDQALVARIQKLILGQTLTSQVGSSGSYAAAKVHETVREDKRRADIRMVTGTVQRLVDALWRLNALPGDPPAFLLQDDKGLEAARGERDAKVVPAMLAAGVKPTLQYWLDAYDWEPEHLEATTPTTAPPGAPALALQLAAKPAQRFTQDQALVEQLTDSALSQAASPIPAAAIARAIRNAESPEDLAERLAALYTGSDAAQFRELMERCLFSADVLGYVTAERRIGTEDAV
jgi:phage gp29-like protein